MCKDGSKGVGKSSALALTSSYYKSLGCIVLHLQNLNLWTSGKVPYARSKDDTQVFTQHTLTASVLQEILDMNREVLNKVDTPHIF